MPVILVQPHGEVSRLCPARPTHDGFYALCIPLGKDRHPVAVQIGAVGSHVEIETILAVPNGDCIHTRVGFAARETPVTPLLDGIVEFAPGLWQCRSDYAVAMIQPPPLDDIADLLVAMAFRPIGRARQPWIVALHP